jgi:hypothetical protein
MPQYRLPSQSLVSFYFFLMHSMRWLMSSCSVYFTPKLLTTSVNLMGRVACRQRPGVCAHLKYPWGARRFLSSLLARIPAWGRPPAAAAAALPPRPPPPPPPLLRCCLRRHRAAAKLPPPPPLPLFLSSSLLLSLLPFLTPLPPTILVDC